MKPIDFTIPIPDDLKFDDGPMRKLIADASQKLGADLDNAIRRFIELCEGVPFSQIGFDAVAQHGKIVKMETHSTTAPLPWESFFIWKNGDVRPNAVMAYRLTTGTHHNEATHAMTFDSTLTTCVLPREEWPVALREYLRQ